MPLRSTFEIGTQIILLQIDGFLKGWILNITPLKYLVTYSFVYQNKLLSDQKKTLTTSLFFLVLNS